jgi:hypothetical protein
VLGLKISGLDARISAQVWGQLPPESQIFDRLPWRASMLTGLGTRAAISGLDMLPEWQSLDAEPAVIKFLVNDYQFVYADEAWWNGLSKSEQDDLLQDCVELVARSDTPDGKEFRMLLDLRQCR